MQTTIFDALERGYTGAMLAADKAGAEWQERALACIRVYAMKYDEMQAYLVRLDAENCGLPKPPDPRAWGHVFRKAAKMNIISATDRYVATDHMGSHGRPQRVWRSMVRL